MSNCVESVWYEKKYPIDDITKFASTCNKVITLNLINLVLLDSISKLLGMQKNIICTLNTEHTKHFHYNEYT